MANSLHSREYKLLTELLRDARRKVHVTQQELADRLGKPQSFVAKYERGERRLDVIEFIKIAHAIGQEPLTMFKRVLRKVT